MKWKKAAAACMGTLLLLQGFSSPLLLAEDAFQAECQTEEGEDETETEYESESETSPTEDSEKAQTESMPAISDTEIVTETEIVSEDPRPETETEFCETESGDVDKTETEAETISEAEPETVSETETESEAASERETEKQKKPKKEKKENSQKKQKEDPENESDEEGEIPAAGFATFDASWYIPSDFRFTKVEKKAALAESDKGQVNVYDTSSEEGTLVGILDYFSLVYILEEGEEWSYVESGNVRGFAKNRYLKQGSYAEALVEELGEYAFLTGTELLTPYENDAFTYTHTTTRDVVAEKQYGITIYNCDVKEYPLDCARAVGEAVSGAPVYILEVDENGWYYVESGDVRGFVDPRLLLTGKAAQSFAEETEAHDKSVTETIRPEENKSLYYSLKSVQVAGSRIGSDIADTALGFVGNLCYIWGGTSLVYGADCSGFVQSVFESYGIHLPRCAEEQGVSGMEVTKLSEARAGDVIYYESGPHVGIYVGNGMVVQCSGDSGNTASNPGKGVTLSDASYMPITSIRRFLIEEEDVEGTTGGRVDLTFYTDKQLQLIWAIVAQEDNGSYEGALAVISSAMNRTESPVWSPYGSNALAQLTSKGQYCYSLDEYWKGRLNGNVPEYVKQAVNDCLKRGIRNHGYTSFRSRKGSATGEDAVRIGGNWYFGS